MRGDCLVYWLLSKFSWEVAKLETLDAKEGTNPRKPKGSGRLTCPSIALELQRERETNNLVTNYAQGIDESLDFCAGEEPGIVPSEAEGIITDCSRKRQKTTLQTSGPFLLTSELLQLDMCHRPGWSPWSSPRRA